MYAIGSGVLGVMITGTVLVVVFAPLFYVVIEKLFGKRRKGETAGAGGANPFFHGLMEKLFGKHRQREAAKTEDVNPSEDR
jgi:peptidoglycan/LPS O-acetylase OafA/YrhL